MADNALLKLGAATFHASGSVDGNPSELSIYRGKNMMLRGEPGSYYFESFGGITNLHEDIPVIIVQGTLSFTANDNHIHGVGTEFKDELHIGQFIFCGGEVLVVEEVVSDTLFLCDRPPAVTASGQTGYKMPILFEIDNKRGTMIWGNALKFDLGNIVGVGEGQLRINGQLLPGQSLISDRKVKLAIFHPATGNYSVERFGYHVTPRSEDVRIAVVAGGKKNMTLGNYSFRWAWANKETAFGFSNPSDVIKIDSSGNSLAVTASNQRFSLDFTHALAHKPSNADSIVVYRSFFQTSARSNLVSYAEGSWFVAATSLISDLEAGDKLFVDVLDEELGTEVTFDNDPPPDAEWVTTLAGDLVLLSCYGEKTVANPDGTSPGPMLVPQRRGNRDSFPAETSTPLSPPDTIIGFAASVGRIFLMTRVGLPFATSTGQADFPITTRPFWQTGFKGPFGLVFINDTLYAFTSKGITRSIASGDVGSDQFAFAAAAEEITRGWYAGHIHAVHDPANELVCFIYSAAYKNDDGWWVSLVLPFSLRQQAFMPLITIEKPGRDMVVCGAAKVNGHLQFLAGGRGIPEVLPGSGSSSEGSSSESSPDSGSTENIAPLQGGIFCCGGECAIDAQNAHLASETGAFTFTQDVVRSGKYSIKVSPTFYAGAFLQGTGNKNIFSGKLYIRFETYPTSLVYIVWSGFADYSMMGLVFDNTTHRINTGVTGSPSYVLGGGADYYPAGGAHVDLDTWYRLDFRIDRTNGKVDGIVTKDGDEGSAVVLPQRLHRDHADSSFTDPGNNNHLSIGNWGTTTQGVWYYDDILVSNVAADYPLGQGYCRAYIPNADGTHNITGTGNFKKTPTGANITNATIDAYTLLDDVPVEHGLGSLDSIHAQASQVVPTDYVEVKFGPVDPDVTPPLTAPRIVSTLVGGHQQDTPSDSLSHAKVMLVDHNTLSNIWEHNNIGSALLNVQVQNIISPPSQPGEPWKLTGDDGNFDKLRARYYSLYGGTPPPFPLPQEEFLDGIIIEAEFEGDEPT